jgi:UDP-glucose 4-epimerase
MTRFLLTLGDSVDLVLYAYQTMKGGEIIVKKAPSCKILTLGEIVAAEANKKFEYEIIGLYPGEKFHEILITEEELARTEEREGFFIIHPAWEEGASGLGYPREYCSADELVDKETITQLIRKSDKEFEDLRIEF